MACDYHQDMFKQNQNIGAVVHELRRSHGVTQAQLASAPGIDHTVLSRVENDERELTARELLRIAGVFGEDVCTVAGRVHPEHPSGEHSSRHEKR
jgi:transcriptional regulator with XRE-family HTH domain